ncbi:hypothetical protein LCGC14_0515110 [marine sediment metagenome]|uniref:Uncharacterized protein n=1 Tax=marine sediment metagenome TaxID=412755 RepID=A0A0F9S054_9ZZZZ
MAKELNKFTVSAILIITLIIIVLVGMAISANYSKVLRKQTALNVSSLGIITSLAAPNTSNAVGSAGTYPFLKGLTLCGNSTELNASNLLPTNFYTVDEGNVEGGTITLNQDGVAWEGVGLNCSNLVYLADSDGQAAADTFTTGLAIFGTFSTIIILTLIGKAIISLFKRSD